MDFSKMNPQRETLQIYMVRKQQKIYWGSLHCLYDSIAQHCEF